MIFTPQKISEFPKQWNTYHHLFNTWHPAPEKDRCCLQPTGGRAIEETFAYQPLIPPNKRQVVDTKQWIQQVVQTSIEATSLFFFWASSPLTSLVIWKIPRKKCNKHSINIHPAVTRAHGYLDWYSTVIKTYTFLLMPSINKTKVLISMIDYCCTCFF